MNERAELSWIEERLYKEMVFWRVFSIVLVAILLVSTVGASWFDDIRHDRENRERSAHWAVQEAGLESLKRMVKYNYDVMNSQAASLQKCAACHTHNSDHLAK